MSIYTVNTSDLAEVTAPVAEPVTLTAMKLYLKQDFDHDDDLITSLIKMARRHVEKRTERALVERTLRADIPGFYNIIQLPRPPLQTVISVKYYNTTSPSTLTTLADSSSSPVVTATEYNTDTNHARILLAYGETWPETFPRHDAVQITFKAGYAPSGSPLDYGINVEDDLVTLIKMFVADVYENRKARGIGQGFSPFENQTALDIISSYRNIL